MERFNFMSKLHEACGDDELRPALSYVYFRNGHSYATDAHILVKQSIEEYCTADNTELLEGKCLHKDSFKVLQKYEFAEVQETGIEGRNTDGSVAFFEFGENQTPPDFEAMFRKMEATKEVSMVGFAPKLIERVSKALAKETHTPLRFTFYGAIAPCLVTVEGYTKQSAIIMPVVLSETLFG